MVIEVESELKNELKDDFKNESKNKLMDEFIDGFYNVHETKDEKKDETTDEKNEDISANTDEAWKDILKVYLKEFLELYWPEAFHNIDWAKGYEFLEQEFIKIDKPRKKEKRVLDTLIKVWHKNGSEQWLLLHLEIQGRKKNSFDERIYIYNYRAFDRHLTKVASMAILIDNNKKWRPNEYYHELWGCSVKMKFPVLKLIDFKGREQELLNSKNPFEVIMGAQLNAIGIRNNSQRLRRKKTIIKMLYERGFGREEIINIGRFLEGIFPLSYRDKLSYTNFVKEIEEDMSVSYLTSFEEIGIEKGQSNILIHQLEAKYNALPKDYLKKIESADSDTVMKWARRVLFCANIEQVFED